MTLLQAFAYFLREAFVSMARSWKVSLLAVLTIAASLFVGGAFALVAGNLAAGIEAWREQSRVIVYLEDSATEEAVDAVAEEIRGETWVTAVELVDRQLAGERFGELFPSLSELIEEDGASALPASLEVAFRAEQTEDEAFSGWLEDLAARPEVEFVDDDRDWLGQLAALAAVARAIGWGVGLVLLGAAVFIIASVVRLTAYLYREEISVMRLVGATEFFIRGPFYAEGLLQGLIGALVGVGGLFLVFRGALASSSSSPWTNLLTEKFLTPLDLLGLVALGAAAGLFGAVSSLRREQLGDGGE